MLTAPLFLQAQTAPVRPQLSLSRLPAQSEPVAAAFLPDSQRLLTADAYHRLYLWDMRSGSQRRLRDLKNLTALIPGAISRGSIYTAVIGPSRAVVASMHEKLELWDVDTAQSLWRVQVGVGAAMFVGLAADARTNTVSWLTPQEGFTSLTFKRVHDWTLLEQVSRWATLSSLGISSTQHCLKSITPANLQQFTC
jgi:WD40 repeat protein